MIIFIRYVLILFLLFFSNLAFAQCPYGIPNTPGCVPPDAWPQNQGGQSVQQRQSRWIYTWGAVAQDPNVVGVSTGMKTKRQAEKAAIKDCRSGGGGEECRVMIAYHHQCVAVSTGGKVTTYSNGPDLEEVEQHVVQQCRSNNGIECRLLYSNCTKPYLVD